jgi:hypothetical protein
LIGTAVFGEPVQRYRRPPKHLGIKQTRANEQKAKNQNIPSDSVSAQNKNEPTKETHPPEVPKEQVTIENVPPQNQTTAPETQIEKTAEWLKWLFTALVYPVLVGSVFILLLVAIIYIIVRGTGFGRIRRFTGGLLPFLMLTFMLLVTDKGTDPIKDFSLSISPFIYLPLGTAIGISLVELGRKYVRSDDDRWASVFNLFISLMLVFLLYSLMKRFLDVLVYFLFSMIMAGGMDIVLRAPESNEAESKTGS